MKLGLKKSILGFNCNEVIEYIQNNHKIFTQTKVNYENEIKLLKSKVDFQEESISFLSAELDKYVAKEAEINELAEKITEMFLVSKKASESILQNAVKNKQDSEKLVEENITAISNANTTFENLENNLYESIEKFNNNVSFLKEELNKTKDILNERKSNSEEFEKTFAEINK